MAYAQSKPNWFVIGISAAVVVVLIALAGVVVWMNNKATAPDPVSNPQSSLVNKDNGALSFGKGDTQVDTFVDFMCPACGQFEDAFGGALQKAASDDKITLNLHPISILDRYSMNTEYSTRAAASVYCVADSNPDATLNYFNALFENRPDENTTGLSDQELIGIANQVGASKASECITDGTYKGFVTDQTQKHEIQGTPAIEIDGKRLDNEDIGTEMAKLLG